MSGIFVSVLDLPPALPEVYCDLDFSTRVVPPGLVYTRSSKTGVWSKEGVYSVLDQNVVPFSWSDTLKSYGLLLDPVATNWVTTTAAYPVGLHFGTGATVEQGVRAPDGTNTAVTVSGAWTGGVPARVFSLPAGATDVSFNVVWRPETAEARANIRFYTTVPATAWLLGFIYNPLTDTITPDAGSTSDRATIRRIRRADGWIEFVGRITMPEGSNEVRVYTGPAAGSGTITGKQSWWYPQITTLPFPTTLILPAPVELARASRAAYSCHMPLIVPRPVQDFSADMVMANEKSRTSFTGSCPLAIGMSTGITERWVSFFVSVSQEYVQVRGEDDAMVSAGPFNRTALEDKRIVCNVNNFASDTSGATGGSFVQRPSAPDRTTRKTARLNFGAYLPNNFQTHVQRVRIFGGPLKDIQTRTRQ